MPVRNHCRIIVNPLSGQGRARELARDVARSIEACDRVVSVFETTGPGDAEAEARRSATSSDPADVIVSMGGDGTLHEVVNGLIGAESELCVVPMGTANILAKEFGIVADPDRIARIIDQRASFRLDAGRVRGRFFATVAGAGFDAEVARTYADRRSGTGSYAQYVRPLLDVFQNYEPPRMEVVVDGIRLADAAAWVLVTNTRCYGGPLQFVRSADPGDGLLDVTAIPRQSRTATVRYLVLALTGAFESAPDTLHAAGRQITVTPLDRAVPYQLDGDHRGSLEPGVASDFEVVPGAVRLIIP